MISYKFYVNVTAVDTHLQSPQSPKLVTVYVFYYCLFFNLFSLMFQVHVIKNAV
jgi:hypothetical protein